jgi:hypothetical protein
MAFWKVYYSDGSAIGSDEISPFKIERRADIQVIVQESTEHNWITTCAYDFYLWDTKGKETRWWGADQFGFYHYMLQPGEKCVLFGTMLDKETYRKIFNQAREEFGNKEIFTDSELRP